MIALTELPNGGQTNFGGWKEKEAAYIIDLARSP